MAHDADTPADNRILVKLRPSSALRASASRANLRPLYDPSASRPASLGLDGEPQWFLADLPEPAATAWDLAHAQIADQLGIAESDVVFAEPDRIHNVFRDTNEVPADEPFALGAACNPVPQDAGHGKPVGPAFAWHLGDDFSQLARARESVTFADRRTRIAHLDVGYSRAHATVPEHILRDRERSFVDGEEHRQTAEDPDDHLLVDNSGHGTGTISILAGRPIKGQRLGGADGADVLPLRIAPRVILLRTSAFARALNYAVDERCDVVTMSMGGLPSRAWREVIDRAYLEGVCVVTAAGNNSNGLPTRNVVYPARYGRVIAACGVMANHTPYMNLSGLTTIEGNFGPDSVMTHAIASYTPNIPWAVFGCNDLVRENGEGTSAATPQIAAAVALWFEKYKNELSRDWHRVEAVRHALFTTAKNRNAHPKQCGNGILQAFAALGVRPVLNLPQTKSDSDSFAFLRVLTGLGIAERPPREEMFNLELAQRWLLNPTLQAIVPDPDMVATLDAETLKRFMEAVIEDHGASHALRRHVAMRYPVSTGRPAPQTELSKDVVADVLPACDVEPDVKRPPYRRLRVYAVDPSLATRFETADINEVTIKVRWEDLEEGPAGEYLSVQDTDPTPKTYKPVNLELPHLLAQDGWAPSEGNAQFHQQMVYAVAMKTIEHFERALGRPVLWRSRKEDGAKGRERFVRQLIVRPHAVRQANAFYSPQEIALQFGYFEAAADDPGDHVPGSRVYACLSHDIIAHETTHALLDGMHRRFNEPTNPDVLALHEAFADIVALFQHFTIRELLESAIRQTRGDIEAESILGSLAVEFGRASGGRGALRDAIGRKVDGVWKRFEPDPADLQKRIAPHARGAVLVGAVFDAFITIYKARIADLLRIYTGGTGILPNGAIHPDLVHRLADEAAKAATHVLNICIRALDYLPPVDVTFFEYLRALITADFDLVPDDRLHYRVAFVQAFRRRGIYSAGLYAPASVTLRTLSVDTLLWQGLSLSRFEKAVQDRIWKKYEKVVKRLKRFADACFYLEDRQSLFDVTVAAREDVELQLADAYRDVPEFATELGLDPSIPFEVHELRRAIRVGPDGNHIPQVIVALTQEKEIPANEKDGTPSHTFRGGSTLVVDLSVPEVKYRIIKNIDSDTRQARTATFVRESAADPLRALFFSPKEPFAALHALADDAL